MPEASEPLSNNRHERFACELAKGKGVAEAYQAAGYDPSPASATRLSKKVNARVEWLKRQAADDTVLTIAEKRQFLARVVRAQPHKLEADSDLWQSVEVDDESIKMRLPSKLDAIKLDNDLAVDGAEAGANRAMEIVIRKL